MLIMGCMIQNVDVLCNVVWQNDVQMAVCLLLCLGDKYIRLVDQQLLQQWFMSYVGMHHSLTTPSFHLVWRSCYDAFTY